MEQYGGGIERVLVTATSGGTSTLVNTSQQLQVFTGSANQTVVLPDATSYTKPGAKFEIYNLSSGSVTVEFFGGSTLQIVPANTTFIVKLTDNTTTAGTWATLTNSATPPAITTYQEFNSSGTYTPTSTNVRYAIIEVVGSGGGGAGSSDQASNNGGSGGVGGTVSFGTFIVCSGGSGAGPGNAAGATGGSASFGVGISGDRATGGSGEGSEQTASGLLVSGKSGGSSYRGGAGSGQPNGVGLQGVDGTGGGGGGGGTNAGLDYSAAGGGAGAWAKAVVPYSSISGGVAITVGTGGSAGGAGTNGFAGGRGGNGKVAIWEMY